MAAPQGTLGAMPSLLLFIAGVLVLMAIGTVLAGLWRFWRSRPRPPKAQPQTIEMPCPVCQRRLVFARSDLDRLSPVEIGLVVSAYPKAIGRPLAEYVCPYCDAAQCFAIDQPQPQWIGVNIYQPQDTSTHCFECHRPLARPPGGASGTTQQVADLSALAPDYGLKCPQCGALCCVACCRTASRGRITDGSLRCPRCFRRPVDLLYFP